MKRFKLISDCNWDFAHEIRQLGTKINKLNENSFTISFKGSNVEVLLFGNESISSFNNFIKEYDQEYRTLEEL